MSMATELMALISSAQRDIDQQKAILGNYRRDLEAVQGRVDLALGGSPSQEEKDMRQQLARTLKQVDSTVQQLSHAQAMLENVLRSI